MTEPEQTRHRRYLLGQLSEDEQASFEQESLMDDERFEDVVAAEDDLIDAYVAGRLPAEDARRFEARFLAVPARRERVEFARALRRLVQADAGVGPERDGARRRAPVSWLPLAAALAAVAVGGWSMLRVQGLSQALSRARGEQQATDRQLSQERARAEALAADLAAARDGVGKIASWTLERGERDPGRSSDRPLPAGAEWVRLRLRASTIPASASLRLVVETAEGRRLAAQDGLRARGQAVDVILPAALFAPGSYVLTLSGAPPPHEVLESYALTVTR